MKAADLRIGNYLECEVLDGEIMIDGFNPIVQIRTIEFDYQSEEYFCLNTNSDHIYLGHYKPIPLTEKWLIDFEMTSLEFKDRYFIKDDFSIDYNRVHKNFYFNIGYDYGVMIEYIHELQNLYFALVGEELTLKK